MQKKKPGCLAGGPDFSWALFCCFDDFLAVVVTAFRANVMRHLRFVALRAGNESRSFELPVGTALIAAGLGRFTFWYCHLIFTSEAYVPSVKSMQWVDAGWMYFTWICDLTHISMIAVFASGCKENFHFCRFFQDRAKNCLCFLKYFREFLRNRGVFCSVTNYNRSSIPVLRKSQGSKKKRVWWNYDRK